LPFTLEKHSICDKAIGSQHAEAVDAAIATATSDCHFLKSYFPQNEFAQTFKSIG
jgi:hypothetical protein